MQLAARGGELENIREILADDPGAANDPPRGYYGQTAIQAACMHGHEQAVQILVDAGADIHFCGGNNFQRNALQIACGHGNEKVVDILLSAGAEVNEVLSKPAHSTRGSPASSVVVTRYNGRSAFQAAAERGHDHLVSRLLRLGADVNAPPSPTAGYTALQAAAGGGYMTILKLLLQHGADINGASAKYKGYTAQGACLGGHLEIVDLLIEEGANVHALGGIYGDGMALHAAAEKGHVDIIKRLLAAGADVNACCFKGRKGQTALQSAAVGGHDETMQVLRDNGAVGRTGGGRFLFP